MAKQGLVLAIDYTDEYSQAGFYSMRHNRPESVASGSEVMRYLIPSVLAYDYGEGQWLIGEAALEKSKNTNSPLYGEFIANAMFGRSETLGDLTLTYYELGAIFFGKIFEIVQKATATQNVYNVTVVLRNIVPEKKEALEEIFALLGLEKSRIKIISTAEGFAYYTIIQDKSLWDRGALLFDFSDGGLSVKKFEITGVKGRELLRIMESDSDYGFSMKDLEGGFAFDRLDAKLNGLYEDLMKSHDASCVFFTGTGFEKVWFKNTLKNISATRRAFKGNNLYVKGACFAGFMRMSERPDYPVVCNDRTKTRLSVEAKKNGEQKKIILSEASTDWFDACGSVDFVSENQQAIELEITSIVTHKTGIYRIELEGFPKRPNKTTRVEICFRHKNDTEAEIIVRDKGFGEIFPSSGAEVTVNIDLEGFIE